MKYLAEFRQSKLVSVLVNKINQITQHSWQIMEICGGQTHAITKYGLQTLLPSKIELIHGPGCPVCVTPKSILDSALHIASQKEVIFCTFGDMMRVPGSYGDLLQQKALGADIRMMYSPVDAVELAKKHPEKEIVLFAVGFETTAPAHAMALTLAKQLKLNNFSALVSLVMVPPAIEFILSNPQSNVDGFLAAGHVCTIMGDGAYHPISRKHQVPIVITGFEPVDILNGLYHCIKQLEEGQSFVENHYQRIVNSAGNSYAQQAMESVFLVRDYEWRGIGMIPKSGLHLNESFGSFDALKRFETCSHSEKDDERCISAEILQGLKKPKQCPMFGQGCTPESPIGAPMVSSEGACRAYYQYEEVADVPG